LYGRTVVASTLILFLTVMLVLVSPPAPVSRTYAQFPFIGTTKTANVSPNPAFLGSLVTVSGSGFQPNCGPPGSGAPCIFEIEFLPGEACRLVTTGDQLGIGGGGIGVLGFAPSTAFFGNLFYATTNSYGSFSLTVLLGDGFSDTNYSIVGFDGTNRFCVDPFTIILQLCVIQVGVEQPDGVVLWLPGYAYPDLPPSSCPDVTEQYSDGSDGMLVFHQFVQNRTYVSGPIQFLI
jgi:hypothetical protein